MTCPTCGKEMQPGRMTLAGRWIRFVPDDGTPTVDVVAPAGKPSPSGKGTDAWNCPGCRRLIADY